MTRRPRALVGIACALVCAAGARAQSSAPLPSSARLLDGFEIHRRLERASIGWRVAVHHGGQQRHAWTRDAARLRLSRARWLRDRAKEVRFRAAGELRALLSHSRRRTARELRGEADRLDWRQRVVEQRGERALPQGVAVGDAQEAAHHLRVGPARRRRARASRRARAVDHRRAAAARAPCGSTG